MKFFLTIIFFVSSCSAIEISNYNSSIKEIQQCWEEKSAVCIKAKFGQPQIKAESYFAYSKDNFEYFIIFFDKTNSIKSMTLWFPHPDYYTGNLIKQILPSQDWSLWAIPERTPHVVEMALSNYSQKLGVSFVTHKYDKKDEVRILYWGSGL